MIGILITQCLLADIDHCREVRVPVLDATTIERCQDVAPMRINEFAKPYDTWFVRTWECTNLEYGKRKSNNL